jgi:hypothetical protein
LRNCRLIRSMTKLSDDTARRLLRRTLREQNPDTSRRFSLAPALVCFSLAAAMGYVLCTAP